MRWITFAIFAYVLLGLEQGLSGVLSAPIFQGATPSLLLILAVYVGFFAPPPTVAWGWLILGVLYDLSHPLPLAGGAGDAVIVGPAALGFLAGGAAILQLRGMISRGSAIAIAVSVFVVGVLVELVMLFLWSARGWTFAPFPGERVVTQAWSAECVQGFFKLLYSSLAALPLGWVLQKSTPLWGFSSAKAYERHGYMTRR